MITEYNYIYIYYKAAGTSNNLTIKISIYQSTSQLLFQKNYNSDLIVNIFIYSK